MEVRSTPGMKTSTPSCHQMTRPVVYFVIHSSTAVLLRLLLSVVPRTLPLGTSALWVISRSATHRRSSLAENIVICHPPRGVLFSICRLVSPFSDVTPSLCLYTAASSPLFAGYCSGPRHCFPEGWRLYCTWARYCGRGWYAVSSRSSSRSRCPLQVFLNFVSSVKFALLTYVGIPGVG